MNLPEYTLRRRKVVWFLLLVLLAGGAASFASLEKKEDALFVIKSAMLVCTYPGATPEQVEELVTEPVEREVQAMRAVHKVTSESGYGVAKVLVELDPATRAAEIPQLWDELRRRVLDVQPTLPEGVSPIRVADDFGDLYGIYYGLSADEGFTWSELRQWAQRIKRELVTLDGVQKVALFGEQTPVVNLYVSLAALANFSIRPETVVATIARQNTLVESGLKQAGLMQVRLLEDGTYRTTEDIADQLLISSTGKQYRLGDVARVERGYVSPPQSLMRVNGRRALGIGISTEAGVDVVRSGRAVGRVLESLRSRMPVGLELTELYPEDRIARECGAVFVVGIGGPLGDGKPHDLRAPDYDDYSTVAENGLPGLNGDLLVWNDVLGRAFEVSSMGIRVDREALLRQLRESGKEERLGLYFHRRLVEGSLPLSVGGGIGQSRLCMLYLRKAHIGEIQASIWPEKMRRECAALGIPLI